MEQSVIQLVAVLVAFSAAWWLRGRSAKTERKRLEQALADERVHSEKAVGDAARLSDALERAERAETDGKSLAEKVNAAEVKAATLQSERDTANRELEKLNEAAASEGHKRDEIHKTLTQATRDLATAVAQRDAAMEQAKDASRFLTNAQERLKDAFLAASSSVFDVKAAALDGKIQASGTASKQALDQSIRPFVDKIAAFQQKIEQLSTDGSKERNQLLGQIESLKTLNTEMAKATEGMTRALRGSSKVRGDWGELMLETVLKASGLQEGINYLTQADTQDDDGRRLRPDVVVLLPDDRQVVVDSKVNLVAFSDATNAQTPQAQQEALLRHAAGLRLHMRELSEKNYPKATGPKALGAVVLFVPIEGALAAALSVNSDLQLEAFERGVVFASPNTLMALLRVIERMWTRDKMARNVEAIKLEAGRLLDAAVNFLEEFDAVGKQLTKASESYQDANRKLRGPNRSITSHTRRLVEFGARGAKPLPDELESAGEVLAALQADEVADASSDPPG